jgi:hypothetical protein
MGEAETVGGQRPSARTADIIRSAFDGSSQAGIKKPYLADLNDPAVHDKILQDVGRLYPASLGPTKLPDDFDNPTLASFKSWHSAHQVKYVEQKGNDRVAVIGQPPNAMTAVASVSGKGVYIVEQLTMSEIAGMSKEDQDRIAALPAFQNGPAAALALSPQAGETVETIRNSLKLMIDQAIEEMVPSGELKDEKLELYTKQLEMLTAGMDDISIFNSKEINDKVKDIKERYERAAAFGYAIDYDRTKTYDELVAAKAQADSVVTEKSTAYVHAQLALAVASQNAGPNPSQLEALRLAALQAAVDKAKNELDEAKLAAEEAARAPALSLNSLDNGKTMAEGFDNFIAQEQQILALKQNRKSIFDNDALHPLQRSSLLFANDKSIQEALDLQQNELIRQYEKLANDYKVMQDQLAELVKTFRPEWPVNAFGNEANISGLTAAERQVMLMFNTSTMGTNENKTLHPLELLLDKPRPKQIMLDDFSTGKMTQEDDAYWTTFQTQLTDATGDLTTNINAEINSAANGTKLATNFNEATANQISKLNEMMSRITQAIG